MLAARDLTIVWGDTPQYWQWINLPESRFSEVAELLNVCWLEIRGKINVNMLSSGTDYVAYLVFTWNSSTYGFARQTARVFAAISGREYEKRNVCLHPGEEQRQNTEYPKQKNDGWLEVELAEYFVEGGEDGDFEVSLMQLTSNWKRASLFKGLRLDLNSV